MSSLIRSIRCQEDVKKMLIRCSRAQLSSLRFMVREDNCWNTTMIMENEDTDKKYFKVNLGGRCLNNFID